jgi:pyruvate-ferredoxin/flavodoxin oxidoreductase
MMAITYGNVYVAQIALGADMAHSIKAIREAEAYDGPSLIIAYSHCIAHGINMQNGLQQQKLAVESGHWPLYRYNPAREKDGLNPFQLDSKHPTIPLKEYLYNETRYKSLIRSHPEVAELLLSEAQDDVLRVWKLYEEKAAVK